MFAQRYIKSLNSTDLRDDAFHGATDALVASARADRGGNGVLGSLLCRVKYADGFVHKDFETGSASLAQLVREWTAVVAERGRSRGWVRASTAWDMQAAIKLYERVALGSLAHWMDSRCQPCNGTGVLDEQRACPCCSGSGGAQIVAGRFETDKIKDMVSELEGIFQAHCARAVALTRKVA